MELPVIIYFISLFDSLWGLFGVLVACLIPAVFVLFALLSECEIEKGPSVIKFFRNWFKFHGAVIAFVGVAAFLAPDKETSYAILAAYGVQAVAETEQAQEVAGKSLQVLEKYMDNYLGEHNEAAD